MNSVVEYGKGCDSEIMKDKKGIESNYPILRKKVIKFTRTNIYMLIIQGKRFFNSL